MGWRIAGLLSLVAVVVLWTWVLPPGATEEPTSKPTPSAAEGLAFFNRLSGTLHIELTEAPVPISPALRNKKALPTARIQSLRLTMEVREGETLRALTDAELESVALEQPRVRLVGDSKDDITHDAPNGEHFTVRDLWKAVEETERRTRGNTEWFGGIDVHHIYFEGLLLKDDGSYALQWGS